VPLVGVSSADSFSKSSVADQSGIPAISSEPAWPGTIAVSKTVETSPRTTGPGQPGQSSWSDVQQDGLLRSSVPLSQADDPIAESDRDQ
jgi:hypothetical protein